MIDACSRATILDMLMQLRSEIGMTVIFITTISVWLTTSPIRCLLWSVENLLSMAVLMKSS
jgi:hypothetical protein